MGRCTICHGTEYNVTNGTILCLFCGTVANSDVRVFQIVAIDGKRLEVKAS